ncbi:Unknown protein sequence [Pseudomonas syringae pv. maculicola]|nr:Unknown protein sequence [Pseudomonas syringae pv. maculicola]
MLFDDWIQTWRLEGMQALASGRYHCSCNCYQSVLKYIAP